MATDTFTNAAQTGNWGDGANWTNGVPAATDDAVVPLPVDIGYFYLPASYTVQSLVIGSLSGTGVFINTSFTRATGTVPSALDVTGNTYVDNVDFEDLGRLNLGTATLAGNTTVDDMGGFSAQTLQGDGSINVTSVGSLYVLAASATTTFLIDSNAVTIGAASGSFDGLLEETAPFVPPYSPNETAPNLRPIALPNLVFQPGETVSVVQNAPGSNTYSVALVAPNGQTIYTLSQVEESSGVPVTAGVAAGTAGTVVTIACFAGGTMILTPHGEVAVEALQIGHTVTTISGAHRPIRWIGRCAYDGAFIARNRHALPILIKPGALADGVPCRELMLSPRHAVFDTETGTLIPAERLVNGVSVVQRRDLAAVFYYHIELASHDVLLADGAPAETFVDRDSRLMFHNAGDYTAMFIGAEAAHLPFCAERHESGPVLDAVQARVAARAGLATHHAGDAARHSTLSGHIDRCDRSGVHGWAFDAGRPHTPVWLDVVVDGVVRATVVANAHRSDLERAGKGLGHCAFAVAFDPPLSVTDQHSVILRRAQDGAPIPAVLLPVQPGEPGPLVGRIDQLDAAGVSGWAYDLDWPGLPVPLEISSGGAVIGHAMADRYRPDLEQAGKAGGRCAYSFRFVEPLTPGVRHTIAVRRTTDGTHLPGSPRPLTPATVRGAQARKGWAA